MIFATSTASGSPLAKAFPTGCWIGKGSFGGTFGSGPVKAKVTGGKFKLALWVGTGAPADAVGIFMTTGVGTGTLKLSGSTLALEVKMIG